MTHVYFAKLPSCDIGEIRYPEIRAKQIASISNEQLRREKYFAWRLLEYAFRDGRGLEISELEFDLSESGRWSCSSAYFSISHSAGALAVAVSDQPCGIDIEPANGRWSDSLAKRYMTDGEFAAYSELSDTDRQAGFIKIWTAKEAIFKSLGLERFAPSYVDTNAYPYVSDTVRIGDELYVYSVALKEQSDAKLHIIDNFY